MAIIRRSSASSGDQTALTVSLLVNLVFLLFFIVDRSNVKECPCPNASSTGALLMRELQDPIKSSDVPEQVVQEKVQTIQVAPEPIGSVSNPQISTGFSSAEKSFFDIAYKTNTDKVAGHKTLKKCLEEKDCVRAECVREKCRPWGHFYDTLYQRWIGKFSRDDAEPFQYLEIGYFTGKGFEAYMEFLPRGEGHSMEISCLEPGPREEGKWPWGNQAIKNKKWYQVLLDRKRLHCGDASDVNYLDKIWKNEMNRPDAPPLKLVIDDASHLSRHMIQTFFFWFPKIEPRGFLVIEDIQPLKEMHQFRTQFLPQIMSDLHYCGDPHFPEDAFFPTLWPLLASISCEMHICIFERNDEPANLNLPLDKLKPPDYALDYNLAIQRTRQKKL